MPLRDHEQPPINFVPFDAIHGGWPMKIAEDLYDNVPPNYFVAPQVQLGNRVEFDVAAYDRTPQQPPSPIGRGTMLAPPKPTLQVECEFPLQDEYEVRIYDANRSRQLVATIEIVSPANKDRPENRRAFVAKCAALLQHNVSVSIVDIVPRMHFNLYADLLDFMGQSDDSLGRPPASSYAVTCRATTQLKRSQIATWTHVLTIGQPLPSLPIGLANDCWVMTDLESSYEQTCKVLGIHRLERGS